MSDPNPWASVLPSVVASVVTTLVTLAITWLVARAQSRRTLGKHPLVLRRMGVTDWQLVNLSKKPLPGLNVSYQAPVAGSTQTTFQAIETYGGIIYPSGNQYIGDLPDGAVVTVNWTKLGRKGVKAWYMASVRMKGDVDEYPLRAEKQTGSVH
ncbi:hypothetical protein [Homoserinibacter gongjuensis]|uniref:DUF3592 domain-containing protein n=1 Tax=Homoserinibacter gongjuensis TaxID=1162968 RepID=A0ABQ6JMV6_9MICO|nr:hypothetical protein [Homoserinibacter gongjuensis]GMA89621.1 hypothetical protein GCM10025869_01500 [Homoserinibacter gongjuensis]